MRDLNVLIVGVGGQGTLLAAGILGGLLMKKGYDVKVSEVHGMSQRGGSVVTYVRAGERVSSPIVTRGEADFILAFEKLEAARFLPYLKKDGLLIASTQELDPLPVMTGAVPYPSDVLKTLSEEGVRLEAVDAQALAQSAGSVKTVNVVLLSRLAKRLPFPKEDWEAEIRAAVKPAFEEMNLKAFALGAGLDDDEVKI